MDRIRDLAAKIAQQEERKVATAEHALHRGEIQRNAVSGTVAIVNLAFIFWAYRRIRRETKIRADALTEVERQKDLLSVTLLSIGDAVIITDLEGRIVLMNKVAEELTGWPLEEGKSIAISTVCSRYSGIFLRMRRCTRRREAALMFEVSVVILRFALPLGTPG